MRKIIHITFYCFAFVFATAQNITTAEYYFDDEDLGLGLNSSFTISNMSQTESISINTLSDGFHDLHIRVFDADANGGSGAWSHYDRSTFYISSFPTGQNIVAARYFFNDEEPSNILTIDTPAPTIEQSYLIPTTGLPEGFHSFYIETQLEDGTWSLYDRQMIYIKDFSDMPSDVVEAEYFIDDAPDFGFGIPFDITSTSQMLTVETEGDLDEGDHTLCVRVKNTDGVWSLYCCATFNVDTLGIEDSLYKAVNVNPNPFKNNIHIEVSRALVFNKISVIDITGKQVYTSTDNLRQLDLSYLESGIYILSLTTENEKATFKIVKQ